VTPNDGGTSGSRTTPSTVPAVRRGAAAAREILIDAAGKQWNVDRSRLEVRDGSVIDPSTDRRFSYSELARSEEPARAFQGAIPRDVILTRVGNWKVLGTHVKKVDAEAIVTGRHRYPSDIVRPNMLYGKVLRSPSYGASLTAVDLTPVRKMQGVSAVHDGNFVGCSAPTSRAKGHRSPRRHGPLGVAGSSFQREAVFLPQETCRNSGSRPGRATCTREGLRRRRARPCRASTPRLLSGSLHPARSHGAAGRGG
jgi:CO/xanthine dehydrogenase Mo-binding subunit